MDTAGLVASLHEQISAFLLYAATCLTLCVFALGIIATKALGSRG